MFFTKKIGVLRSVLVSEWYTDALLAKIIWIEVFAKLAYILFDSIHVRNSIELCI